jgi:hypothetical protein
LWRQLNMAGPRGRTDEPIAAEAYDLHRVGLTFARDVVGAGPYSLRPETGAFCDTEDRFADGRRGEWDGRILKTLSN